MTEERGFQKYVWVVMLVLSVLLLIVTLLLLLLSGGTLIFEQGLEYAGSSFVVDEIEEAALGYINLSMLKPLWEEVWIGILGIYCALGLRQKKKHAWTLGLFWGIMLISNAVIQGIYELIILNWSQACMQTYLFLFLGVIVLVSLLFTRKAYFNSQTI